MSCVSEWWVLKTGWLRYPLVRRRSAGMRAPPLAGAPPTSPSAPPPPPTPPAEGPPDQRHPERGRNREEVGRSRRLIDGYLHRVIISPPQVDTVGICAGHNVPSTAGHPHPNGVEERTVQNILPARYEGAGKPVGLRRH